MWYNGGNGSNTNQKGSVMRHLVFVVYPSWVEYRCNGTWGSNPYGSKVGTTLEEAKEGIRQFIYPSSEETIIAKR